MRTVSILIGFGLMLTALACGSKNSPPAVGAAAQPQVAPTTTIERVELRPNSVRVINSDQQVVFERAVQVEAYRSSRGFFAARYWDQGDRILLVNANGNLLLPEGLVYPNARITVSNNIAVIRYTDKGSRVLALNTSGEMLVSPASVYPNAHVSLSDQMVAVSYEDQGSRVLAVDLQGRTWVHGTQVFFNPQIILDEHRLWIEHDQGIERFLIRNDSNREPNRDTQQKTSHTKTKH